VLTILAVLSAVLFPVFQSARASAYRTACASNLRQAQLAATMYLVDYDDLFMPVNYRPAGPPDPVRDRSWVQLVLPYMRSFTLFKCPADFGRRESSEAILDDGVIPGDAYAKFYYASLRANTGYNFLYYSPVVWSRDGWIVQPRSFSQIGDSSRALLFVDSVFGLTKSGTPFGGGNYIVVPPCRFALQGGAVVDTFGLPPGTRVYSPSRGWEVGDAASPLRYGFAWPWHDGRMNIARAGGGSISVTPVQLAAGCDVKRQWSGFVRDLGHYFWDWN
jgi:type II secretory pathway pseudopilin PulG